MRGAVKLPKAERASNALLVAAVAFVDSNTDAMLADVAAGRWVGAGEMRIPKLTAALLAESGAAGELARAAVAYTAALPRRRR